MMYVKIPLRTPFIFFKSGKQDEAFKFSSDLEKIGVEWDVSIQNGTYVEVISEPIEITRPQYGTLSVVKIRADVATDYHTIIQEFWVPANCIKNEIIYRINKVERRFLVDDWDVRGHQDIWPGCQVGDEYNPLITIVALDDLSIKASPSKKLRTSVKDLDAAWLKPVKVEDIKANIERLQRLLITLGID